MHEDQWNTGCHVYDQPQILHDMNSIVMLTEVAYLGQISYKMPSYDP